jgi:hypothetical protein
MSMGEITMRSTWSHRPLRALLAASLLVAGGVALSATAAHASTETFTASVTGGYNNTHALGTASGTITATSGATTATYSVSLCGQSTYPSASVTIVAGSASVTHSVSYQNCQTFTGTLTSGYGITTATVTASGSTFYPGSTYTTYTKTRTVYFSGGTPPITPPATPVTAAFTAAVTGGYNNTQALGTATGTITATRGGTTATYSVNLCGQSTYPSASVTIVAGGASATHSVSYQNCQTFTGTLTSGSGITTATITASGSTFYPGNTYTTYTKSRTVSF